MSEPFSNELTLLINNMRMGDWYKPDNLTAYFPVIGQSLNHVFLWQVCRGSERVTTVDAQVLSDDKIAFTLYTDDMSTNVLRHIVDRSKYGMAGVRRAAFAAIAVASVAAASTDAHVKIDPTNLANSFQALLAWEPHSVRIPTDDGPLTAWQFTRKFVVPTITGNFVTMTAALSMSQPKNASEAVSTRLSLGRGARPDTWGLMALGNSLGPVSGPWLEQQVRGITGPDGDYDYGPATLHTLTACWQNLAEAQRETAWSLAQPWWDEAGKFHALMLPRANAMAITNVCGTNGCSTDHPLS